jgi:hypothetical protein
MVSRSTSLPSTLTPTLSLILIPVFMRGNKITFHLRNKNILLLVSIAYFFLLYGPHILYNNLNGIIQI